MTLIVSVQSSESLWLVADRRLTFKGAPPREDARKLMFLETEDGVAILGYAGLGVTALGTEPADWMSAVLRGRKLPLEKSLEVLADAIKNQLPQHLVRLPVASHTVIVPAFVNGEPRLYTIDLAFAANRKDYKFRYTRHVRVVGASHKTPRMAVGGSGALSVLNNKKWLRSLLRVVNAHEQDRVSATVIANHLAKLNTDVFARMRDGSVGSKCIVAWRYRKGGAFKSGGGHQFYSGIKQDSDSPSVPVIAGGMDVAALIETIKPFAFKQLEAPTKGEESNIDDVAMNAALATLPEAPDDKLR